jgi:hypothetical protein
MGGFVNFALYAYLAGTVLVVVATVVALAVITLQERRGDRD